MHVPTGQSFPDATGVAFALGLGPPSLLAAIFINCFMKHEVNDSSNAPAEQVQYFFLMHFVIILHVRLQYFFFCCIH